MNPESLRIAAQLRNAFAGKAWHGPSLSELLADITAEQAAVMPTSGAHSIHELVLHIEVWVRAAIQAAGETPMQKLYQTEKDWQSGAGNDPADWANAKALLFQSGEQLALAIEGFSDARLQDIVPGREYDFYYLFHGVIQHSLYHGGQIAMLRRAVRSSAA